MIEEFSIRNFQCIRRLDHDLDGGILTIVGESDHGKSAIIRALGWVLFNEAPANFISWGETECSVSIRIDGHTIERRKGRNANLYIVDGSEYAAVRDGVPPQAAEIINAGAYNVQGQFDPSFWVSSTAGERARMVNEIANLDIIDCAFKEINSEIRRNQSEISALNGIAARKKAELARLKEVLPRLNEICGECLDLEARAKECASRAEGLEEAASAVERISAKVRAGARLMSRFGAWKRDHDAYSALSESVRMLETAVSDCKRLSGRRVPSAAAAAFHGAEEVLAEYERISEKCGKMEGLVAEYTRLCASVGRSERSIAELKERIERESGGTCPFCGGKLNV